MIFFLQWLFMRLPHCRTPPNNHRVWNTYEQECWTAHTRMQTVYKVTWFLYTLTRGSHNRWALQAVVFVYFPRQFIVFHDDKLASSHHDPRSDSYSKEYRARGSNDCAKHVRARAPTPSLDVVVRYTIVLADYSQFYGVLSRVCHVTLHTVFARGYVQFDTPSPLFTLDTRLSGSQPRWLCGRCAQHRASYVLPFISALLRAPSTSLCVCLSMYLVGSFER